MSTGKILAIDLGEKRIGLALGDATARLSRPLGMIPHRSLDEDIASILSVAAEHEVTRVIIGQSLGPNGEETGQSRHASRFAAALSRSADLPVTLWDESLSSQDARRLIRESGARNRRKAPDDALAAAVFLQSYLDSLPLPSI